MMEKRITLQYMEEAIKAYESKSERVKRLLETSKIIEEDYDKLENENNQLKDFIHKNGLSI